VHFVGTHSDMTDKKKFQDASSVVKEATHHLMRLEAGECPTPPCHLATMPPGMCRELGVHPRHEHRHQCSRPHTSQHC